MNTKPCVYTFEKRTRNMCISHQNLCTPQQNLYIPHQAGKRYYNACPRHPETLAPISSKKPKTEIPVPINKEPKNTSRVPKGQEIMNKITRNKLKVFGRYVLVPASSLRDRLKYGG